MGRILLDLSPSLDGFIAGAGVSEAAPFGDAGHRLHAWLGFEGATPDATDKQAVSRVLATAGAVVIGRRMFDVGIAQWGEDGAWERPCFVVTHRRREDLVRGSTTFCFVTDGLLAALERARATAGKRDVVVAGGADIARQCLATGMVDELRLHVVPVLLGHGTRLWDGVLPRRELRLVGVEPSANALHQTWVATRPDGKSP